MSAGLPRRAAMAEGTCDTLGGLGVGGRRQDEQRAGAAVHGKSHGVKRESTERRMVEVEDERIERLGLAIVPDSHEVRTIRSELLEQAFERGFTRVARMVEPENAHDVAHREFPIAVKLAPRWVHESAPEL